MLRTQKKHGYSLIVTARGRSSTAMNFRINRCLRFEEQREQKESVLESRQIEFNSATVDWLEFSNMFRPSAEILGLTRLQKIKDPYSGKIFLTP